MKKFSIKILIIGAGVAGKDIVSEINKNPDTNLYPVGFLDDNLPKGTIIEGLKVLGKVKEVKKLSNRNKIDEVIIAIPSGEGEQIAKIVRLCSEARLNFKIVPRVIEIIEGKAYLDSVRDVEVEDLLGRPVVKSEVSILKEFIHNKCIFITGAAGSIGSELTRQIAAYVPRKLIVYDWWENGMFELNRELNQKIPDANIQYIIGNIQDYNRLQKVIQSTKPDFIFHAAAYKHVPLMEENIQEAIKNNILGTFNVARAAKKNKVTKCIFISTDKAADPVSIMGMTKYIGEAIMKSMKGKTRFITVRFGNVLGSHGSVIPTFKKQILLGGPVTITDPKMTRYFMTIPEAVQLILKATHLGNNNELFILDMGKPLRILDVAENLIRLSGKIPYQEIPIKFTGRRKGEKLHEKLFTKKEKPNKSNIEKIFIVTNRHYKTEHLQQQLKLLSKQIDIATHKNLRLMLKSLVQSVNR